MPKFLYELKVECDKKLGWKAGGDFTRELGKDSGGLQKPRFFFVLVFVGPFPKTKDKKTKDKKTKDKKTKDKKTKDNKTKDKKTIEKKLRLKHCFPGDIDAYTGTLAEQPVKGGLVGLMN